MMRTIAAALGLWAMTAGLAAAQQDQQSTRTGTSRITGRVIAADDGRPVRRAEISVSGHADGDAGYLRVTRTLETDADGRFEFVGLPAGEYAIYFHQLTGFVQPGGYEQTRLVTGQAIDVTFRLERTGAIEGRILDDNGDPALGIAVVAVNRINIAGYTSWGTHYASATTDDRGAFRIFNLPAGDYYVVAQRQRFGGSDQPPPPPFGFVTTYYPGSMILDDARAVTVSAGRDTTVRAFKLLRRKLASVSVTAADSEGNKLGREGSAHLRKLDAPDLPETFAGSRPDESTFVFGGVEPGDYSLIVSKTYMGESSYSKIHIADSNVALQVQTNVGARVSGRVKIDGKPAKGGPGLPNAWVMAQTPSRTYGVSYSQEPVVHLKGSDRFELTGLRGPLLLSGDVSLGKMISIRTANEDLAGKVIEFAGTEAINDVVVDLTTQVARLDVHVSGSGGLETRDALVFIFPSDRQRWRPGLAIQVAAYARSSKDDRSTSELPYLPGKYFVAAIKSAGVVDPADPALLETLVPLATAVDLAAGDKKTITVPMITESKSPR